MKKKEFKSLRPGDRLIVTGKTSPDHYHIIGATVEVGNIKRHLQEVLCEDIVSGLRQQVCRKDLSLINK
jgi:hypothetical protein